MVRSINDYPIKLHLIQWQCITTINWTRWRTRYRQVELYMESCRFSRADNDHWSYFSRSNLSLLRVCKKHGFNKYRLKTRYMWFLLTTLCLLRKELCNVFKSTTPYQKHCLHNCLMIVIVYHNNLLDTGAVLSALGSVLSISSTTLTIGSFAINLILSASL